MTTCKYLFAVGGFLLVVVTLESIGESEKTHTGTSSQTFSIAKHGDLIYLPVCNSESNKDVLPFLFVTSSDRHVIDARLLQTAAKLPDDFDRKASDSRPAIIPIYNSGKTTGRGITLRVADSFLRGPDPIHVLDLSLYQEAIGRDFHGLVGAPFLRKRVVQIDFDRGTMRIDRKCRLNRRQDWETLPSTSDPYGVPHVSGLELGHHAETFMLNTGDIGSVQLHKWLFDSLLRSGHIRMAGTAHFMETEGKRLVRRGRLDKLVWGPFILRRLNVDKGNNNSLGLSFLSRFVICLDLSGRRIYLRKGRNFDKPDLLNETGIHILKRDGRVIVAIVDCDSIAERAGVLENDDIITINGRPVAQMSLYDIRCVLREAHGKRVTLSLTRKGSVVKVSFVVPVDSTLAKESGNKEKKPVAGNR